MQLGAFLPARRPGPFRDRRGPPGGNPERLGRTPDGGRALSLLSKTGVLTFWALPHLIDSVARNYREVSSLLTCPSRFPLVGSTAPILPTNDPRPTSFLKVLSPLHPENLRLAFSRHLEDSVLSPLCPFPPVPPLRAPWPTSPLRPGPWCSGPVPPVRVCPAGGLRWL